MSVAKSKPETGGSGDSKRGGTNARGSSATSPNVVVLTRERIQATLDEFADRGRVTRADANDLVAELIRQARRVEPVDRIVRTADRARRTVGVGPAFPILGYDELTAGQVNHRLGGLTPPQLRKVRDYERRHANRKTVLEAIEKAL
jgi:hypothetical protein